MSFNCIHISISASELSLYNHGRWLSKLFACGVCLCVPRDTFLQSINRLTIWTPYKNHQYGRLLRSIKCPFRIVFFFIYFHVSHMNPNCQFVSYVYHFLCTKIVIKPRVMWTYVDNSSHCAHVTWMNWLLTMKFIKFLQRIVRPTHSHTNTCAITKRNRSNDMQVFHTGVCTMYTLYLLFLPHIKSTT